MLVLPDVRRDFVDSLKARGFAVRDLSEVRQVLRGEVHGHVVSIELTAGFPFFKPVVVPDDVRGSIHQDFDGALCLYPDDAADSWMPYFDAEQLLARINEWFDGYDAGFPNTPGGEPLDGHLYYRGPRLMLAYGDDMSPLEATILGLFGIWPKNETLLVASGPTGMGASPVLDEAVQDLFDLRPTPFEQGIWMIVSSELEPQANLEALLGAVEAASGPSVDQVVTAISGRVGAKIQGSASVPLAIAYPDGTGSVGWLFLRTSISKGWRANLQECLLQSYEPAPAGSAALLARIGVKPIQTKRVLVFGCGALGSTIAILLAREGARHITLVDGDRLRPTNIVRHEGMKLHIGEPKVSAVRLRIKQAAPYCHVETRDPTWDPKTLADLISASDVIVCATGSPAFELLINVLAVGADRPCIYVGAYNNASVGRVQIVRPGYDPCLQCIEQLKKDGGYPLIPASEEQQVREVGCNHTTAVASPVDLTSIALEAARATSVIEPPGWNLADVVNGDQPDVRLVGSPRTIRERFAPISGCATCGSSQVSGGS